MDKIHEIAGDGALMPRFDDGMVNMTELIRVMAESLVNEIMDAQADEVCESGNQRNGYRERRLVTSVGTINLRIPKLRAGSYFPEDLIERYSRVDRAVIAAVSEMVTNGVSTRKVKRVAQSMGIDRMSASQVSRICSSLDASGADGGVACLGGSLASARFVAPAGGAFGADGVVAADGSVAAHVTIEPVDTTASAGETGGPDVPGDGPSAPGTDPATGESATDPSTNPTLKPAAATKTVTTTVVTNTTAAKTSRPKAATATSSSLPKAGDNCWITASLTFFLLGIALLCAAIRC